MTVDKFVDLVVQHKEELKEKFNDFWFIEDIETAEDNAISNLTYGTGANDPRDLDPNALGEETYEILKWDWEQWLRKNQAKETFIIAQFHEGAWPPMKKL